MHCTLYRVQYALYTVQNSVCSVYSVSVCSPPSNERVLTGVLGRPGNNNTELHCKSVYCTVHLGSVYSSVILLCTVQYSAAKCRGVFSTVQWCVQYSIVQYCVLYSAVRCSGVYRKVQ